MSSQLGTINEIYRRLVMTNRAALLLVILIGFCAKISLSEDTSTFSKSSTVFKSKPTTLPFHFSVPATPATTTIRAAAENVPTLPDTQAVFTATPGFQPVTTTTPGFFPVATTTLIIVQPSTTTTAISQPLTTTTPGFSKPMTTTTATIQPSAPTTPTFPPLTTSKQIVQPSTTPTPRFVPWTTTGKSVSTSSTSTFASSSTPTPKSFQSSPSGDSSYSQSTTRSTTEGFVKPSSTTTNNDTLKTSPTNVVTLFTVISSDTLPTNTPTLFPITDNVTESSEESDNATAAYTTSVDTTSVSTGTTILPDKSVTIIMTMLTPYNTSTLDKVVAEGKADELGLLGCVSEVTNVNQSRLSLVKLEHGPQNGTLIMQFEMAKGADPRALTAAQLLQEEVNNETLVFVDLYDNNIYPTNMTYAFVRDPGNNCDCTAKTCAKGQCTCTSDGVAYCDCSGSKCDKSQAWKVPVIVVLVLLGAFTILLITAIICCRRHQMNSEYKEEAVIRDRPKREKKKKRVKSSTPATITSKGSEKADSIVFTVLEEGPTYEMREKSKFEAGSLPRSEGFHSVMAAAAKNGTTRGAAFHERSFSAKDKISRAASKLSHQY